MGNAADQRQAQPSMNRFDQRSRSLTPFLALTACAVLFLWMTCRGLPDVVASHFDVSGQANGFMSRGFYFALMLIIVAIAPLALAVLPISMFNKPGARINLPNGHYWLAPERRADTIDFLSRQSTRFAAMTLVFLCYTHWLVVRANAVVPPHLSSPWFLGGLVVFLLGTLVWVISLLGHFRHVPHEAA